MSTNYVPDGSAWITEQEWQQRKRDGRVAERRVTENARRVLEGQRCGLTVRRPWANLIFSGKTVENRTWATHHRGELVIHAGQGWDPAGAARAAELGITGFETRQSCPDGYLGIVRLTDVHPAADCCAPWGEPGPDVFHWVLTEPRPLQVPVPARGRQGLYWVPADALELP